jgi:hypothetical protein
MTSTASSFQGPASPHGPSSFTRETLNCTLFLFDDKLLIVKRQHSSISGRQVTGVDDIRRMVKTGGGVVVKDKDGVRKDKLIYRGVVNLNDVIASDVGNGGK